MKRSVTIAQLEKDLGLELGTLGYIGDPPTPGEGSIIEWCGEKVDHHHDFSEPRLGASGELMMTEKWQQKLILDEARAVRTESDLDTTGLCAELSERLHWRLERLKIKSRVVNGYWVGPVRRDYPALELWWPEEDKYPSHAWLELEDRTILDLTADQFIRRLPPIYVPRSRKFYSMECPPA